MAPTAPRKLDGGGNGSAGGGANGGKTRSQPKGRLETVQGTIKQLRDAGFADGYAALVGPLAEEKELLPTTERKSSQLRSAEDSLAHLRAESRKAAEAVTKAEAALKAAQEADAKAAEEADKQEAELDRIRLDIAGKEPVQAAAAARAALERMLVLLDAFPAAMPAGNGDAAWAAVVAEATAAKKTLEQQPTYAELVTGGGSDVGGGSSSGGAGGVSSARPAATAAAGTGGGDTPPRP